MQLTAIQIRLIKKSWEVFRRMDAVVIGDVFYGKLFLDYPALQKLFKSSMTEQYQKLVDMLTLLVSRLERIDEITDEIKAMAVRHVEYGVKAKHYTAVGEALLWTLQQGLGSDWTAETEEAWSACYSILATAMIEAVY